MHEDTVVRFRKKEEVVDTLAELLRRGARELIGQAVHALEEDLVDQRHPLLQRAGHAGHGAGTHEPPQAAPA